MPDDYVLREGEVVLTERDLDLPAFPLGWLRDLLRGGDDA